MHKANSTGLMLERREPFHDSEPSRSPAVADAPTRPLSMQLDQAEPPRKPLPRVPAGRKDGYSPLPSGPGGATVTLADLGPGGRSFIDLHKLLAPDCGGQEVSDAW
eukprot:CAMPEP_0202813390 /NCGR_PEP_ID=MMETSP1389-20130828/4765_1 /ASSEMBLY_ACC=CAM_ASM_000865 /TAXON_ID=302021 /ORGANISM="Rhodomonas sp., Strain CCMP768" /LENGTH=105 /DNA_ID=CAMNT_0049484967 /DNA_START=1 /DNA_END=315 /DNA_ORIENTATION=-